MDNEQQTPENAEVSAAPTKKAPVRRSRAKKVTEPAAAVEPTTSQTPSLLDGITTDTPAAAPEPAVAPAKRAPRRRATAPVTAPAPLAGQGELTLTAEESGAAEPTATKTAAAKSDTKAAAAADAQAEVQPETKAPARRSRSARAPVTKVASVPEPVAVTEPAAAEVPEEKPAKAAPRRASRRTSSPATASATPDVHEAQTQISLETHAAGAAPAAEAAPPAEAAPAAKATRSRRRSTSKSAPVAAAEYSAAGASAVEDSAPAPAVQEPVAKAAAEAAPKTQHDTTSVETPEQETADAAAPAETPAAETPAEDSLFLAPAASISALFLAPDLSQAVPATKPAPEDENDEDSEHDADRRGRVRNRNRRPRTGGTDTTETEDSDSDSESETETSDDGVTSRRRRRRRRGDTDLEMTGGSDEDPPNTVTRVRAPRTPSESTSANRVTSLRGSTRLEAKKQRRRDSRDSGRRRTVITEAEFLARRESVDRVMVVNQADDRIQIGVLEDGILAEHFVSKTQQDSLIGNVYVGKVQNVLPSMEAAFVDIGRGRNAVLYAGEVDWDAANLNGQPRRIENALKSGDSVLVQVSKDPVGHKGARLTSQISLPGRYLVFVPGGSMTGISRKLPDVERNRLKRVLKDHLPENAGVIVRTAAEGASEEELTNDINRLRAQWEGINERASSTKTLAPEMLYAEPDLTIKVVRDVFNEDFSKLIVSGEDAWDTIEAYVTYVAPDLLGRLEKWTRSEDIFAAHRIDEQINKALERKVFLPSGGSLVIDRTEAMTVVDVNTGKFTGSGGNLEETVTKNNLEAAEEVVRQLRLRDIGGIIVIDFIDMVLESNRDLVLRRLVECLGRDRTKHQVAEVTSLGLVQMTRKRMGTGLLEVFGEQCSMCAGRGMVTHEIPVEHRRTHSPAVEVAHAHAPAPKHEPRENERTASRSTRSERKRNRNRSQQPDNDQHDVPDEDTLDEVTEAAKAQKANEARAALASIAAASHHENDAAPAAAQAADEVVQNPETHDGATLTFGGEAIELPRGHRSESADFAQSHQAEQAAALAGLAQALDQLVTPERDGGFPDDHENDGGSRSRSRRSRRNRSARSAQGGADTAVETSEPAAHPAAQEQAVHTSSPVSATAQQPVASQAPAQQTAPAKKSSEPIILGVGVPASEL